MGEIFDWDVTDADNSDLWPEGMLGGQINDSGRAMQGAMARWFDDTNGSSVASGSSNAFAATSNRAIPALFDALPMAFTANHSITGPATLNLNGLGAKSIKRFNGNDLASGDIVSGQPVTVVYNVASDVWFMWSAPAALTGNSFVDLDENGSPGNPAADDARLYAYDDGGTTVLAYRDSSGVVSPLRVATQAEMETPNDERIVRSDRQHFHPGHPKAWARVSSAGALVSGYGVASVSRDGTGFYTITLSAPMLDTNYIVVGTVQGSDFRALNANVLSTTQFTVATWRPDNLQAQDLAFAVTAFGRAA